MRLTLFLAGNVPPSSIPPRLSDVSFFAVSNTDHKLLEAGSCQEWYSLSAKGMAGCGALYPVTKIEQRRRPAL